MQADFNNQSLAFCTALAIRTAFPQEGSQGSLRKL